MRVPQCYFNIFGALVSALRRRPVLSTAAALGDHLVECFQVDRLRGFVLDDQEREGLVLRRDATRGVQGRIYAVH